MNFKIFFKILQNCLSDGANAQYFLKELIEMITDADIDNIFQKSNGKTTLKDDTLRKYTTNGISKKLARTILKYQNPNNMIESINSRDKKTLQLLVDEFSKIYSDININNISERITEIFINILKEAAGLTPTLVNQESIQAFQENLKNRHGDFLVAEAHNHCPFLNCDDELIITNNGLSTRNFNISKIDKTRDMSINNLIALCPKCYLRYQSDNKVKTTKKLKKIKKLLMTSQSNMRSLSDITLHSEMELLLTSMKKLSIKENESIDINYEPIEITKKIKSSDGRVLFNTVKNLILDNYFEFDRIIINLSKSKKIDYTDIQYKMKSMYKTLTEKKKNTKQEIFDTMSNKIHNATLVDIYYCQLLVAYFIQKCEVF